MSSKLPKGWKSVNLGDVAKVESGYAFKSGEFIRNGIPIVRINNLDKNGVNLDFNISYSSDFKQIDKYKIEFGDILIGMSGSIGKVSIYKNKCIALLNQRIGNVKPINQNELSKLYLYYFLRSEMFVREISKSANGCIISNISSKDICNVKFNVPDMQEQQKIVSILEIAENTIKKRTEQIEALDELVKSRFIEMFGDPVKNPKEWNKVNIGSKFEIKTGATPSRKENTYWENGTIPWVKTTELKEVIINEIEEYITQDGYDNSSVNLLPKETLLIAMYGQGKTRGMTGKLGIEATTNQACAAILPNSEENMDFVWYQLKLSYEDLRSLGRGGSQPNLNTNLIKSYELIFPPMKLQNQFVDFVNQVDKLKSQMETSLKELEDNFNSLMQKAFKGELF